MILLSPNESTDGVEDALGQYSRLDWCHVITHDKEFIRFVQNLF